MNRYRITHWTRNDTDRAERVVEVYRDSYTDARERFETDNPGEVIRLIEYVGYVYCHSA